jgi:hypothetical protein
VKCWDSRWVCLPLRECLLYAGMPLVKVIALKSRPLTVKAQNPVIGLLKGTLIWTASATRSSI